MNKNDKYYVVGAGITGLAIAYLLAKDGKKVTLLESSDTEGGLLGTFEIGGEPIEQFYHHFFTHDKELMWLVKELMLEDKLIFKKTSMGFLFNKKQYSFNSLKDILLFKPISFFNRLQFLFSTFYLSFIADWRNFEKTSALNWLSKYTGKSTTNVIWSALFNSKFGEYANKIPLSWLIGRLKQRASSRKKGDESLGYFNGGFKVITDSIKLYLKQQKMSIRYNSPVISVNIENNIVTELVVGEEKINTSNANVIFTIPVPIVETIFEKKINIPEVRYFGAVCVILELNQQFGEYYWLNIGDIEMPFGGIIEHTNFIDKQKYGNKNIVYLSRYFTHDNELLLLDDESIKEKFISQLSKINPEFNQNCIQKTHLFKSKYAAPVVDNDFTKKIIPYNHKIENLFFANMTHIYPDERSTNNSIKIAIECCKSMGLNINPVIKSNSLATTYDSLSKV